MGRRFLFNFVGFGWAEIFTRWIGHWSMMMIFLMGKRWRIHGRITSCSYCCRCRCWVQARALGWWTPGDVFVRAWWGQYCDEKNEEWLIRKKFVDENVATAWQRRTRDDGNEKRERKKTMTLPRATTTTNLNSTRSENINRRTPRYQNKSNVKFDFTFVFGD